MQPKVIWMTASPQWGQLAQTGQSAQLQQPALLRFNNDKFMDELRGLLNSPDTAQRQANFAALQAQAETFLTLTGTTQPAAPSPMKLYQPIHGHFYLVACTLVCRMPGFPDRKLQTSQKERASFVLRRLQSVNGVVTEFGLIAPDAVTPPAWQPVADPQGTTALEARIPLCPLYFQENGRSRRMLVGLIPVANKQNLDATNPPAPSPLSPTDLAAALALEVGGGDPRAEMFRDQILAPISDLQNRSTPPSPTPIEVVQSGKTAAQLMATEVADAQRDAQQLSTFILLDMISFLNTNIPAVFTAVISGTSAGLSLEEAALYTLLGATTVLDQNSKSFTWNQAMAVVWGKQDAINSTGITNPALTYDLSTSVFDNSSLEAAVTAALPPPPSSQSYLQPAPNILSKTVDTYCVRCVFDQPECRPLPNGPPVPQSLVSQPSAEFQLAKVFDPDAPARTVTLALPVDTSIAGLRKFKKNVRFIMSDMLRNQMERINEDTVRKGTTGPSGGFSLGHICSFSFEIMFIIAFVLMFVFLLILNIVFWWIAFFKICFPIPVIESD